MYFYCKKSPVKFDYKIDGIPVGRVSSIRDPGTLFDQKVSYANHIDCITSKAWFYDANIC